jgi:hypothetical protein
LWTLQHSISCFRDTFNGGNFFARNNFQCTKKKRSEWGKKKLKTFSCLSPNRGSKQQQKKFSCGLFRKINFFASVHSFIRLSSCLVILSLWFIIMHLISPFFICWPRFAVYGEGDAGWMELLNDFWTLWTFLLNLFWTVYFV